MSVESSVAYFSMEVGLVPEMPTYSGGLGVLAGDTIRAAADLGVPMVAVTLVNRRGYFDQHLDAAGNQTESPVEWTVSDFLEEMTARGAVTVEGRTVALRAWRYEVAGVAGAKVPVYFLDSDLPENAPADRELTHYLYGGDERYRLCQEIVLGMGGVRMLAALGHGNLVRYHMNEGHAALLAFELLEEEAARAGRTDVSVGDVDAVRRRCVFTTHTPVAAGTDRFSMDLTLRVLGEHRAFALKDIVLHEGTLNMTYLALNLSHYVNGVAKKHGETSRHMFAPYVIDSITNGVHVATWASASTQGLFDRHVPGWRRDNFSLRYAMSIPKAELWESHMASKRALLGRVNRMTNAPMDADTLTICFARRATGYKRADLLVSDIGRLKKISREAGRLQVIYSGKAHPNDGGGKDLIRQIFAAAGALAPEVPLAYLADYDIELAKLLVAGADIWLNTPQPPLEASGTSGMKAAVNGVPSLSILDGWWIEGCIEGVTGWSIGDHAKREDGSDDRAADAESLYDKLEKVVVPTFYRDRGRFQAIMLHAIALNGSFFNTHRMMQQYVMKAYFL